MEGDRSGLRHAVPVLPYFYPRPPGGGRLADALHYFEAAQFLSTPFQKATKIQLLFNKLIAVAGTNVGMNAF